MFNLSKPFSELTENFEFFPEKVSSDEKEENHGKVTERFEATGGKVYLI